MIENASAQTLREFFGMGSANVPLGFPENEGSRREILCAIVCRGWACRVIIDAACVLPREQSHPGAAVFENSKTAEKAVQQYK